MSDNLIGDLKKLFKLVKGSKKKSKRYKNTKSWLSTQLYK